MIITKEVSVFVNASAIKRYTDLGYTIKNNDFNTIKVDDLSQSSHITIDVKCDFCGKEHNIRYCSYIENFKKNDSHFYCTDCKSERNKKTSVPKVYTPRIVKEKKIVEKQLDEDGNEIIQDVITPNIKTKTIDGSTILKLKSQGFDVLKSEGENHTMFCNKGNHEFEIKSDLLRTRIKFKSEVCTKCNPIIKEDIAEEVFDFISEHYKGEIKFHCGTIIPDYELDVYIPALNLAFDFNVLYQHSELFKDDNYHKRKTDLCEEKGIFLIQVFEDDWVYKKDILKSMILNRLGLTTHKIYARKCEIREIQGGVTQFLDENHLQGAVGASIKLGLFYEGELVSLMTMGFGRKFMNQIPEKNVYEMMRYCNKQGYNIIGGASKIWNYFIKKYDPIKVTTYADCSYSNGNLYRTLGFTFIHKTEANYYYIIDGIRKHRFGFRKDTLISEGFDGNLTEHQIMLERKLYRIFNSGNYKFIYEKKI